MTTVKKQFEPGHGYSKEDWDEADVPPLTDEQIAKARPFAEVFPDMAKNMRASLRGRPPIEKPKQVVSIRLDPDVVAKFKATGKGWQGRINEALKKANVG